MKISQNQKYYRPLKEAVDLMTEKLKAPLLDLIGYVDATLELIVHTDENGKRRYDMRSTLTDEELEFLAIKIPTTCLYVQEQLNGYALDVMITEYLLNDSVTEKLKGIVGGDARERQRFAEQQAEVDHLVMMIKKQVYQNLRSYIERADRVYEGVKKVLDGKNREKGLFAKS